MELEKAQAARGAAEAEFASAEAAKAKLVQWRAEQSSAAKAAEQQATARAEAVVLREACKLALELQEKLLAGTIGSFLDTCNGLCEDVLGTKLSYRDGDLYISRKGRQVRLQQPDCSGTEKKMADAAVCLALACAATGKLRLVVLDELDTLDDRNKVKLVSALCRLHEQGKLDQAVLTAPRPVAGFEHESFLQTRCA